MAPLYFGCTRRGLSMALPRVPPLIVGVQSLQGLGLEPYRLELKKVCGE
jgi:hypothetical protein